MVMKNSLWPSGPIFDTECIPCASEGARHLHEDELVEEQLAVGYPRHQNPPAARPYVSGTPPPREGFMGLRGTRVAWSIVRSEPAIRTPLRGA